MAQRYDPVNNNFIVYEPVVNDYTPPKIDILGDLIDLPESIYSITPSGVPVARHNTEESGIIIDNSPIEYTNRETSDDSSSESSTNNSSTSKFKLDSNGKIVEYDITGAGFNMVAGKKADSKMLLERQQYIMKLFTDAGMSPAAAAGIIGNLLGEGLRSSDTGAHVSDGKAYSYGIAGFYRFGAARDLESWCKNNGLDYRDWKTQAYYLTTTKQFRDIIEATKGLDPGEALRKSAVMWGFNFEKFQGFDAGDKNGNIVGRGKGIKTKKGIIWGRDNYLNRIRMGIESYNNYGI